MQPLTVTSPYEKCRVGNLKGRRFVMASTYGLVLLAICGLVVLMAYHGQTVEDRDCTAVVLFAPMALYLLCTKEIVIY